MYHSRRKPDGVEKRKGIRVENDAELLSIKKQLAELEARLQGQIPGASVQSGRVSREYLARVVLYDTLGICDVEEPPRPDPKPIEPEGPGGESMARLRARIEAQGEQLNRIEAQVQQILTTLRQRGK